MKNISGIETEEGENDFVQSTNEMIDMVGKTFQDQVCCFVSNMTEMIELPEDINVLTHMLEVELNRIFLEFGADILLEEISIMNQGWLNTSRSIDVDVQDPEDLPPRGLVDGSERLTDSRGLLALTLNATYRCGGYCPSSTKIVDAEFSDRLNSRLQPLSEYLRLKHGESSNPVPRGNVSISCYPCGGWNWADGFSNHITTPMFIPMQTCHLEDLLGNENPFDIQKERNPTDTQKEKRNFCEYKLKMLPIVMAQYEMRTSEYTDEVEAWTTDTARDAVAIATFRRKLELLEIYKKMRWVWDQTVSSGGFSPLRSIQEEIFYNGKEVFGDIKCEIEGLNSIPHSRSDSLKLAELFAAIYDQGLWSNGDDIAVSELNVTQNCLWDDDNEECIDESSIPGQRRKQPRNRRKRRFQFKGGVTCRACRVRYPPRASYFWELFVNSQYATSIMENLGHLVEGNVRQVEVTCEYVDTAWNFWDSLYVRV
eukprot:scaffold23241_cov56-Attheya_sp.AAC.5